MPPALLLAGRILLLAGEQLLVKRLAGGRAGELAVTFLFFAWATLALLPFALGAALGAGGDAARQGMLRLAGRWPELVAAGLVYTAAFALYVAGLVRGELSRVAPLAAVNQLALLVLAVGFGGERPTLPRLAGMALMAAGTVRLARPVPAGDGGAAEEERWAARATVGYGVLAAAARLLDREAAAGLPPVLYAAVVDAQVTFWTALAVTAGGEWGEVAGLLRRRPGATAGAGAANAGSYLLLVLLLPRLPLTVLEPAGALAGLLAALAGIALDGESGRGKLLPALLMAAGSFCLAA